MGGILTKIKKTQNNAIHFGFMSNEKIANGAEIFCHISHLELIDGHALHKSGGWIDFLMEKDIHGRAMATNLRVVKENGLDFIQGKLVDWNKKKCSGWIETPAFVA